MAIGGNLSENKEHRKRIKKKRIGKKNPASFRLFSVSQMLEKGITAKKKFQHFDYMWRKIV